MDLTEFYRKFIDLTDRILPALPSQAEKQIFLQLFARSLAVGETSCQLSHQDYHDLTGLSVPSIRKALHDLQAKGIVRIVAKGSAHSKASYELLWPQTVGTVSRLQREPRVLLKDLGVDQGAYTGIVTKLSAEDREVLNVIVQALPSDKEARYREMARAMKNAEDPQMNFLEVVVLSEFGPQRLRRYVGVIHE